MQVCVRNLGISPGDFWRMTFVEFIGLYRDPKFRPRGMTREQMAALMEKFPDKPTA